jgi:predicted membrane metal-binding protein
MLHRKSPTHFLLFAGAFIFIIIFFIFYTVSQAVILDPENMVIHTTVVYYDGKFSESYKREDTKTALFILNQSDEVIYATAYEYDKFGKDKGTQSPREKYEVVQILGWQNQFMKTEGPGVIYLNNSDQSAKATFKFSKWFKFKYFIPDNFKL